jgi:N-acetylmuramoyl-L-alanine amidase
VPAVLRRDGRGEAVRDLQARLSAAGQQTAGDESGEFGTATEQAVRAFQEARGLRIDGIVGPETWSSLVESGFTLGDRLLYRRRPMLRGDDVAELQLRLNALGFDAGREDGILGDDTGGALTEFQRAAGLASDGICGSTTIAALDRVGSFAAGSAAGLRERERLRTGPSRLEGRRVYVAASPGFVALGEQVTRGLLDAGAAALLDASGSDDSSVAEEANRFGADLLVALRAGVEQGSRCAYYASERFRSEIGHDVAESIRANLDTVLPATAELSGRSYGVLRETRMPAVVCELVPDGDVGAMRDLVTRAGDAGRAIVLGVRHAIEVADPESRRPR